MTKVITPIVGAHFRPPAVLLLRVLPVGHPLFIEPEPTNEFDLNALRVMLSFKTLDPDNEAITNILSQANLTSEAAIADFVNKDALHLGYVANALNPRSCVIDNKPSKGNIDIIKALGIAKQQTLWRHPAKLTFSMSGQSLIEVEIS